MARRKLSKECKEKRNLVKKYSDVFSDAMKAGHREIKKLKKKDRSTRSTAGKRIMRKHMKAAWRAIS